MARLGGEEFVVLLPGCGAADATALAERARTAVAGAGSGDLPTVRMSAGVASADAPESIQALAQASDMALYSAKRAGRDRIAQFEAMEKPSRPSLAASDQDQRSTFVR